MKRIILTILFLLVSLNEGCEPQHQSKKTINKEKKSVTINKPIPINSVKAVKQTISFDEHKYFRITSQFTGPKKSLAIMDDNQDNKVNLGETGNDASQAWKIQSLANGYFRFTTKWKGKSKSLNVHNDDQKDKKLWLSETTNSSRQKWKIQEVGNGYYKLTNQFLGEGKSLDVLDDGKNNSVRLMETGDYSGQLWKITAFK